jgi:NAD(P)-dependent dehydrogenase (short-subunit alcohol dehydrogenase family)
MRHVVVTGAGRGLGLEWTRQCLLRGDQVFAGVRNPDRAQQLGELKNTYGERLELLSLEVTDDASLDSAFEAVRARTRTLDLLVNNAGINSMSQDAGDSAVHLRLGHLQAEPMLRMFHVNAVAPLMMAQRFLPLLQAAEASRVVSVSSWLGSLAGKSGGGNYSYCASKTALNMLMRAFAFDVLPLGIISVVVNPGWVQTDMGGPRASSTPEQAVRGLLQVVDGLTEEDAGKFFDADGQEHPW